MRLQRYRAKHCDINCLQISVILCLFGIFFLAPSARAECNSEEWDCDDGVCIDSSELCDGIVHCADGSDETTENCIGITCPQFAFRCAYGACIAGNAKCNREKDCADNSDEVEILCADSRSLQRLENELRGNCSDNSMQCKSGECIEILKKCDGQIDCADDSDETVEICSTVKCPPFAFRCGYGGCINGNQKCDGTINCIDASDEASRLCGTPRYRGVRRKEPTTPIIDAPSERTTTTTRKPTTTISTTTTTTSATPTEKCQLPSDPYMIIRSVADVWLQPGSLVVSNTIVKFQCLPSYTLLGRRQNFCSHQNWRYTLPKCQKFCNATLLTIGLSTRVHCEQQGGEVPCSDSVPPDTVARFGCASGFNMPQPSLSTQLRCQTEGVWSFPRFKCQMKCGTVAPHTTKFSRGGTAINITETPWHVGIYSNFKGPFIHICGGTIISPRLVLSAAHCFWNEANSKLFDKKYYNIVAGKYFREYNDENEIVQRQPRNITEIILHPSYNDRNDNFRGDITALRLEFPLTFTASIRPICIKFLSNARKEVDIDLRGKFAGWGVTDDQEPSPVLQSVTMKAIPNGVCRHELQQITNYDLPDDKFCLKDEYGKSACRGDSGGGFVRAQNIGTETYHFLVGIVSHAPVKDQDCARDGIVALTNVNYFESFIQKLIEEEIEDF